MVEQVLRALVGSENEAADDVLLECLRVGSLAEKVVVLGALIERGTTRGMGGVIAVYDELPQVLQVKVLAEVGQFYHALRECGRSDSVDVRLAAMKLIAVGKQGKLAYVLSENLYEGDERLVKGAVDAMVALARWVAGDARRLQAGGEWEDREGRPRMEAYRELLGQRAELEAAVVRAMDGHRGRFGAELIRAGLLLCDWPGSKVASVLNIAKHGAHVPMHRRLLEAPAAEHVDAFLLAMGKGALRGQVAPIFAQIDEKPVLDAFLRRTYLLKSFSVSAAMHQVQRGAWWDEGEMGRELARRESAEEAARGGAICAWVGASGLHDAVQDERMVQVVRELGAADVGVRLGALRVAMRRKRGGSTALLRFLLADPDERIARVAAREMIRRRPADAEAFLLGSMGSAGESVRRVVSRAIGQSSFDSYWVKFDRLDKATRRQAGRAMLKVLPDAVSRLQRRLNNGPTEQRIKALVMAHELGLAEGVKASLVDLVGHPNPKVRSKAVAVLGAVPDGRTPEVILDRVLMDEDARVRANAIEVLEARGKAEYVPLLTQRARGAANRERANAIKAMHRMKVGPAVNMLTGMLADGRPEHRISALWALQQMGMWKLVNEVGRVAKEDPNLRVRRYALGVLKGIVETIRSQRRVG